MINSKSSTQLKLNDPAIVAKQQQFRTNASAKIAALKANKIVAVATKPPAVASTVVKGKSLKDAAKANNSSPYAQYKK